MSWIYDPLVLILTPPSWPLCRELRNSKEAQNALAQIVLAVGVALSIYKNSTLPLSIALAILVTNYILWDVNQKKMGSFLSTSTPSDSQPKAKPPAPPQQPRPMQLPPWSPQSFLYPNNPAPYDFMRATRGQLCPRNPKTGKLSIKVQPDNAMSHMNNSPEIYAVDDIIAPLPDPTFIAQHPFNPKTPMQYVDPGKSGFLS